jgi:hypothetical protein
MHVEVISFSSSNEIYVLYYREPRIPGEPCVPAMAFTDEKKAQAEADRINAAGLIVTYVTRVPLDPAEVLTRQ